MHFLHLHPFVVTYLRLFYLYYCTCLSHNQDRVYFCFIRAEKSFLLIDSYFSLSIFIWDNSSSLWGCFGSISIPTQCRSGWETLGILVWWDAHRHVYLSTAPLIFLSPLFPSWSILTNYSSPLVQYQWYHKLRLKVNTHSLWVSRLMVHHCSIVFKSLPQQVLPARSTFCFVAFMLLSVSLVSPVLSPLPYPFSLPYLLKYKSCWLRRCSILKKHQVLASAGGVQANRTLGIVKPTAMMHELNPVP